MTRRSALLLVSLLTIVAFAMRYAAATRQGLDIDEVFSLAIATGHSIEQPAAQSDSSAGDFIEAPAPAGPAYYTKYSEHGARPAGIGRVVRATYLSDTNPPLYYVLLNGWTRLAGTTDLTLRLFSIILGALSVPLGFALARRLDGRTTGVIAAAFLAIAPQAVFYGALGRMYPLLALETLGAALFTLELHRRGFQWRLGIGWIVISAAGLLSHYFFAFAWIAMCAWAFLWPHRLSRVSLAASIAAVAILVAPWYARVPSSLAAWRVTKGWLETAPKGFNPVVAQVRALVGWFLTSGDWMDRAGYLDHVLLLILALALVGAFLRDRQLFQRASTRMLLFWMLFVNAGLLVFDVIQHTYTRQHSRYAYAGISAALILLAMLVRRLPFRARMLTMVLLLGAWVTGFTRLNRKPSGDNPFRGIAQTLNSDGVSDRVIVVHAIPTGVMGLARYLDDRAMMIDWVEALGTRDTVMLSRITNAVPRVTLIKSPSARTVPEEIYFNSHGRLVARSTGRGYERLDFELTSSR